MITDSWGLKVIEFANNSLILKVNGFKYKGKISISFNNNKFKADIEKSGEILILRDPYTLIFVLDDIIEKTEDYEDKINTWLTKI